ncbi:MAG: helix-turn-helix domain-containing protein [Verrucomicrobia bacterium]|nr:helix-turn-helix domain-containing protein [Verrucomicrobiota bacterium]MBU4366188.1 helix-turn-helix domain-containing protein [Verrucomicrobiota bacterium]
MKTKKNASLPSSAADKMDIARRLRSLRLRCRLSMREVAILADVAPSYISGVERARISPTIAALRKLLNAMGSDLGSFFAAEPAHNEGYIFRRQNMRSVADKNRCYTFIFPRRKDMKLEMIEEEFVPGEKPAFETINSDFAGYIIAGQLLLEIRGKTPVELRAGDAFYVPAGTPIRGRCFKCESTRLITVQVPPNY